MDRFSIWLRIDDFLTSTGFGLSKKQVNGIVKAIYKDETSGFYYIELVSVVLEGHTGSRREYVLMEHEIIHIYPSRD